MDIVERLRGAEPCADLVTLRREAADEIERLRGATPMRAKAYEECLAEGLETLEERIAEPMAPHNAKDQADRLAQLMWGRNARARDLIGGSNAMILQAACDCIEQLMRGENASR